MARHETLVTNKITPFKLIKNKEILSTKTLAVLNLITNIVIISLLLYSLTKGN